MTLIEHYYAVRQLLGLDTRTIKYWEKRNVDFIELLNRLYKSKTMRDFRNKFYDLFKSIDVKENDIDKLWEKFVNNKLVNEKKIEKRKWGKK